jgi:hypothetical protein
VNLGYEVAADRAGGSQQTRSEHDHCARLRNRLIGDVVDVEWGFFRRRSAIFCEGDQQFCDSDQESERSDAGFGIVSEVIGMVKEKVEEFDLEQGMRGGRRGQRLRPLFPHPPWRRLLGF